MAVGVDRGVATTVATSDGGMYRVPTTPKLVARIGRLQAGLARQRKGSARRAMTKLAIARTHARIATAGGTGLRSSPPALCQATT